MSRLVSLCERCIFIRYFYDYRMATNLKESISKADVDITVGEVVLFILTVCIQNCLTSSCFLDLINLLLLYVIWS